MPLSAMFQGYWGCEGSAAGTAVENHVDAAAVAAATAAAAAACEVRKPRQLQHLPVVLPM
jgi:hypothetical protein